MNGDTYNIEVTGDNVNQTLLREYTPKDQDDKVSATITYQNNESAYNGSVYIVESEERNMLYIKASSVKYKSSGMMGGGRTYDVGDGQITISGSYTDKNGTTQTISHSTTGNGLIGGIYIVCPNLDMTKIGSINVTIKYSSSYNSYDKSDSLQNLHNGTQNIILE